MIKIDVSPKVISESIKEELQNIRGVLKVEDQHILIGGGLGIEKTAIEAIKDILGIDNLLIKEVTNV